ncbi:MAG: DUF167 domain-containing protein [Methanimicrococcus sp.]|nr:DUF167 domain-containing protein [Methanimicrococcus sp.]
MPFSDALRFKDSAVFIDIEVTPGSKIVQIPSGYNEWRKRIEVKLSEAAQKGKANEQLIEQFAILFNISSAYVSLENGWTNSKKTLRIDGISLEAANNVFEKIFETK